MIKKENLDKTSAWPFVEAKKMLRERKSFLEKKGKITLQTGYGPSGLPHIGTFGEVARTSMMVNALKQLTDLPAEIITFSDDMDGLRKVPDNVPNKELLEKNLHKPLTDVPDPFEKYNSFGEHNNEKLKKLSSLSASLPIEFFFTLGVFGKMATKGIFNLLAVLITLFNLSIVYLLQPGILLIFSILFFPLNSFGLESQTNSTPSSSAFATSLADPGIFSLSLLYKHLTDFAFCLTAVLTQSIAVSPPPTTTTFLF